MFYALICLGKNSYGYRMKCMELLCAVLKRIIISNIFFTVIRKTQFVHYIL